MSGGLDEKEEEIVEKDGTGRYIRFAELLGTGAFKEVYKAIDREMGIEVAWNCVRLDRGHIDFKKLLGEVQMLQKLHHPHIIQFFHSWPNDKKNQFVFITECMTSGTLKQFIRKAKKVRLKVIKGWCRQILEGLKYLHTQTPAIIHRDIKCDNIFINGSVGEVKIGDLGLATVNARESNALSIIGTPEFMAPEFYEEKYNEKVDIWAFGMAVVEMTTHEYPYSECQNAAQIFKKVSAGILPAALSRIKDKEVTNFISLCLSPSTERPSSSALLEHPFLQNLDDENTNKPVELVESISEAAITLDEAPQQQTSKLDDSLVISFNVPKHTVQIFETPKPLEEVTLRNGGRVNSKSDLTTPVVGSSSSPVTPPVTNSVGSPPITQTPSEASLEITLSIAGTPQPTDQVLNFELKLRLADDVREIQFGFDLTSDTAPNVASEMVQDLQLPASSQVQIAQKIQEKVDLITKPQPPKADIPELKPVPQQKPEPIREVKPEILEIKPTPISAPAPQPKPEPKSSPSAPKNVVDVGMGPSSSGELMSFLEDDIPHSSPPNHAPPLSSVIAGVGDMKLNNNSNNNKKEEGHDSQKPNEASKQALHETPEMELERIIERQKAELLAFQQKQMQELLQYQDQIKRKARPFPDINDSDPFSIGESISPHTQPIQPQVNSRKEDTTQQKKSNRME